MVEYEDLKLLAIDDAEELVPVAKKLIKINLTTISTSHKLFPRIAQIVPRGGDYGLFESSGTVVEFKGKLDSRKVNRERDKQVPRWMRDQI